MITILIYANALACVYFSVRSYTELVSIGAKKTILGIGSIVLAAAIIAAVLWFNRNLVQRTMWQLTLNRLDNRLQNVEAFGFSAPGGCSSSRAPLGSQTTCSLSESEE